MTSRKLLQRIFLIAFGFVFSLLTLELAIRTYAWVTKQDRTLRYDSVLGWSLNPKARRLYRDEAQPYWIRINSRGWRDREHSYEKPLNDFRIVVVGDSFVFGAGGVEVQRRFTELLETSLPGVEVINMGVPGFSTDQEYLTIEKEAMKYHPDLVLLCEFMNDFRESFLRWNYSIGRPKGYFSTLNGQLVFHPPSPSNFDVIRQRSHLLALIDRALRRIRHVPKEEKSAEMLTPPERIETYKLLLTEARQKCRRAGAEFVVVYFPIRDQAATNPVQDAMQELATTEGLHTLDLADKLREANAERPAYFERDVHFNEYGHQVVAHALSEYLITNGLVPSSK